LVEAGAAPGGSTGFHDGDECTHGHNLVFL
jgi:hypothetical protein